MRKEEELDVESRFPTSTYKHCPPKPLNRKHTHHHAQDSQEFLRRTLDVLHDELALDLPPNQDEQASSDESASGAGGAKDNSSTDDEEEIKGVDAASSNWQHCSDAHHHY